MKRLLQVTLVVAASWVVPQASDAEVRTWTDITGQHRIQAEYLDFRQGTVQLRKSDGQIIWAPLDKLSLADQEYVRRLLAGPGSVATSDLIELLSGAKLEGRVTGRDAESVTIQTTMGGRNYTRKYPLDRVLALTIGGRREVLNEAAGGSSSSTSGTGSGTAGEGTRRTKAQVEALINELGRTPPEWFESTPLEYPRTLDLSWPQKPPGGWDAQRNVGQYLWDVIHPNPSKWRQGLRLMHHLLVVHKDHPATRIRVIRTLGSMHYNLFQDYARAAFWWRQGGIDQPGQSPQGVRLAECYWKLGNKQMALELLNKLPVYYTTIKLLADMGETRRALQLAEGAAAGQGGWPDWAYLYAGDACRITGQFGQAIEYYRKVLDVPATGRAKQRIERSQQRARANIEGIKIFDALDLGRIPDGTYQSDSAGYAGQVQVKVVVRGGRIESVEVTRHQEKQFYSALTDTPRQIVQRQGVRGVDAVTGATITSEAIVNATAKALAGGMR